MSDTDRFDEAAATWDEEPRRVELSRAVAEAIGQRARLPRAIDVLDFGAGTGLLTLALQPLVRAVTGADTSSGMLGILRRKIEAKGLENVETVLLEGEGALPPGARFDLVVSSMALHHVADLAALFGRFREVLRARGEIALADLDREDGSFHEDARGVFHLGFERNELLILLTEAGFTDLAATTATATRKEGRDYSVLLITGRRSD
jgi:tRNA (cmo5U34)-methyltransferase